MHTALARAAVYGTVYCCIPESLSISHLRWHPPNAELGSTAGERGPTPERVGFTVSGASPAGRRQAWVFCHTGSR